MKNLMFIQCATDQSCTVPMRSCIYLFIWNNNELNFVNYIHTTYQSNIADTTFISFSQIEAIGQLIYTYAAILLIICSIILLLSMIAPIFISLNKK